MWKKYLAFVPDIQTLAQITEFMAIKLVYFLFIEVCHIGGIIIKFVVLTLSN
jgi:hypothetical protein